MEKIKFCKDCKNRGLKPICCFYPEMSNYAERCRYFDERKPTNAERIRSMSDEKLAEFLTNIREPDDETLVIEGKDFFAENEILKWLQSETEG